MKLAATIYHTIPFEQVTIKHVVAILLDNLRHPDCDAYCVMEDKIIRGKKQ